jgi:hypothetical protein
MSCVLKSVALVHDIVQNELEDAKPEDKEKLVEVLKNIERNHQDLNSYENNLYDNKNTLEIVSRMLADVDLHYVKASKTIVESKTAQYVRVKIPIAEPDHIVQEVTIEGQELTKEEAKENPIAAVAQDLKVATAQWVPTENSMVAMCHTLSEKLSTISAVYRQDSQEARSNLLTLSKNIQNDSKLILFEAQKIADACKDKVLKNQVIQAMESIPVENCWGG